MTDRTQPPDPPADGAGDPEPIEAEIVEPAAPALPVVPSAPPPPLPPADYDEHGVPSLDYVRGKIEGRYATSVGAAELAGESAAGRTVEQEEAERADKARAKLEEIRRSLGR
ncbi:MAG TPA: hypothetical protein VEZ42_10360 [Pseudonocardia sp.]|jgi:hypothetical protein|nr:hypothetical protein [Pseudonocardia sp.]